MQPFKSLSHRVAGQTVVAIESSFFTGLVKSSLFWARRGPWYCAWRTSFSTSHLPLPLTPPLFSLLAPPPYSSPFLSLLPFSLSLPLLLIPPLSPLLAPPLAPPPCSSPFPLLCTHPLTHLLLPHRTSSRPTTKTFSRSYGRSEPQCRRCEKRNETLARRRRSILMRAWKIGLQRRSFFLARLKPSLKWRCLRCRQVGVCWV